VKYYAIIGEGVSVIDDAYVTVWREGSRVVDLLTCDPSEARERAEALMGADEGYVIPDLSTLPYYYVEGS
jgi:hypothetical protein